MLEERVFRARAEAALAAFHRMMKELARGRRQRARRRHAPRRCWNAPATARCWRKRAPRNRARAWPIWMNCSTPPSTRAERGESLRDFLDHAALVSDADSADERAPVSLLTMHNAKGLEFPVVFIAGLEEGLFPHSRSLDSESAMEEERRLCYVGMTRAEQRLYLSWARYRRRFGGGAAGAVDPSRFLKEVPPALLDALRGEPSGRASICMPSAGSPRNGSPEPLYWKDL